MIESKQVLINEYVKALRSNTASVFVGAGFSCDLVHFDWNKLIEPFRKKLGLTKRTIIDKSKNIGLKLHVEGPNVIILSIILIKSVKNTNAIKSLFNNKNDNTPFLCLSINTLTFSSI